MNNLQFLCENGRVQKFANSFCSPAFMLQEYRQLSEHKAGTLDFRLDIFDFENNVKDQEEPSVAPHATDYHSHSWSDYVVKLSSVLCSFLLAPEDIKSYNVERSIGRISMPVSSVYGELSIKWIMRVLLTVFPCLKACSNQNDLPIHLR